MSAPNGQRPWWLLPPARVPAVWWLGLVCVWLPIEYLTGYYAHFPLLYVVPVSLAAYYSGRFPALALAIVFPVAHFVFTMLGTPQSSVVVLVAMELFRGSVIVCMAFWFSRLSEHERALHRELETLRGLLPICAFCKSIKNDAGEWERLEGYISRRSQTTFTHGICPSCKQTQYPSLRSGELPNPRSPQSVI